ncbi:hypothetical protein PISS_b6000 [Pseudoalteromonas issachenkonii]|uniref:Uncharacterized protein n=1 Tax=Pseudoalteromonas issachenkonii TaxID=152297 RepID=A0ABM6N7G8_9GAMM|nr:hypothetical protein PISS_b6000 [Pseudoalteromonas issachenkonii]
MPIAKRSFATAKIIAQLPSFLTLFLHVMLVV